MTTLIWFRLYSLRIGASYSHCWAAQLPHYQVFLNSILSTKDQPGTIRPENHVKNCKTWSRVVAIEYAGRMQSFQFWNVATKRAATRKWTRSFNRSIIDMLKGRGMDQGWQKLTWGEEVWGSGLINSTCTLERQERQQIITVQAAGKKFDRTIGLLLQLYSAF